MKVKTGFSFRHAIGHVDDVIARLKEIGWSCAPISDRVSTFGYVRWTRAAQRAGLRPVYGCELPVTDGKRTDYWSFFAMDGLKVLHELIQSATSAEALTLEQALESNELVKIMGNRMPLDRIEPQLGLFVPLSPSLPIGLARQAIAMGHEFMATSDNRYVTVNQREIYRVVLGHRAEAQSYDQHIQSDDEWTASVEHLASPPHLRRALDMREAYLERCQATLAFGTMLKPKTNDTLRGLCEIGAKRLGIDLLSVVNGESYGDRLNRELAVIEAKQFEDYFLILADVMQFARQNMTCGPGRGSSGGSLVCYLTGITAIDPLRWNLLFERFLDPTRGDAPDIDIDLSDSLRHLAFEYVSDKYGQHHVAHLGTVIQFRPRSLLNQIGTQLKIPKWQIEKLADGLIERTAGDMRPVLPDSFEHTTVGREFIAQWPEVQQLVPFENHPNVAGQHAAGLIMTEQPIVEHVAIDARNNVGMIDKNDAEALGLLKIDALGLKQLGVFERTLQLIGIEPKSGWLEQLPLDDPAAFAVLNDKHYAGVFQFNGKAQQQLAEQITFKSIDDIVAITALGRPGPMQSGAAQTWIRRHNGEEAVTTVHPKLTALTRQTLGVLTFQEQIMQVARDIGGLPWEDVTSIRQAISKSRGDAALETYHEKFCAGAIAGGIEPDTAETIWKQMATMGGYAFVKAHATAYAINSVHCLWLKAHHPVEFAAATLDAETDPDRQILLLRELEDEGIGYKPVDREHSTDRWMPFKQPNGTQILLGPLSSIKNIGPAAVVEIMKARESGEALNDNVGKLLEQADTEISTLYPIKAAIAKLHPSLPAAGITTAPTPLDEVKAGGHDEEIVVLGVVDRLKSYDENEPVRVQRRNGKRLPPPTAGLNAFLRDDSGSLLCRIDRFSYNKLAPSMLNHDNDDNKKTKALYAFKGKILSGIRMMIVSRVRFLGDME